MIKNFYSVKPNELKEGDVLICLITAHIMHDGSVRVYRCPYPNAQISDDGIPQGNKVGDENSTIKDIFPVLAWYMEDKK